jgi:hypothetical protein
LTNRSGTNEAGVVIQPTRIFTGAWANPECIGAAASTMIRRKPSLMTRNKNPPVVIDVALPLTPWFQIGATEAN